jgi:hypothetical protein
LTRASYAVLFKTHFWDDFCRRQLERLRPHIGRGELYVVVDETFGARPEIGHDRVIGVTREDLRTLGLPLVTTQGPILWYNTDYPSYVATAQLPKYDFIVALEYDVAIHLDLDGLIDELADGRVDFLGFPMNVPAKAWRWYPLHKDLYGPDMLIYLSSLSVFSRAGITALLARRQARGKEFMAGTIRYWPFCEAFLPNEIRQAGLKIESLERFGATKHFNWWPPFNEADLPDATNETFIHPVLDGIRFVRSTIFHEPSTMALIWPGGSVRRRLHDFSPEIVEPILRAEIRRRILAKGELFLQRLGLRPKWYAQARSDVVRGEQEKLQHNTR